MYFKHLLVSLALSFPAISFADSPKPCLARDQSLSSQKFWAGQHDVFVRHGLNSLKHGDLKDADESLYIAKEATLMTCAKKMDGSYIQLRKNLMQIRNDMALLIAAKYVAKHEYGPARVILGDITTDARNAGLNVPEQLPTLMQTANQGVVTDYFERLDRAVANGLYTPEKAAASEKRVCQNEIPQMHIDIPERCKQYMK